MTSDWPHPRPANWSNGGWCVGRCAVDVTGGCQLTVRGTHDHDHERIRLGDGSRPRIRLFTKFCSRQKDSVRRRVDGHGFCTQSRFEVLDDLKFAGRCLLGDGEAAIAAVLALTDGVGADAVAECVGTADAFSTAVAIARPGSTVGYVGVPHGVDVPINTMFFRNIGLRGGAAPVRTYIPELLDDVLQGRINPGRVFDFETDLEGIAGAYAAMDERRAIKSLVRVGPV